MRWCSRAVKAAFLIGLLVLCVADTQAQTHALYPWAAGCDSTFTGFAYVPRTFDLTKNMPTFEKLITSVPDTTEIIGWSLASLVGDGDIYLYHFKNGAAVLGVDRPDTLIVTDLGDGTYVLVTGR
jgi:hypothetical protein